MQRVKQDYLLINHSFHTKKNIAWETLKYS